MRTVYASATSMWKLNNSRYRKAHSALFIPDNNELVRQREYLLSTTGFHLRVLSRPPSLSLHSPTLPFRSSLRIHPPYLCPQPSRQFVPSLSVSAIVSVYRAHIIAYDVAALWRSGGGGEGKIVETRVSVCVWTGMIPISRRITIIRREGGENEVSVRNLVKGVL